MIYVALLAAILFFSSGSVYSFFSNRLEYRFARFRPRNPITLPIGIISPTQAEVRTDLINSLLIVNGFLLFIAGVSSYWLAGVTLKPIQEAYDRQRRFLGDASHELRTPLAILQTDLENELSESYHTEEARKRTKSHLEEVSRMSVLVNDLLTLSRLDEQTVAKSAFAAIDICEVIQEAVERLRPIARHHGVTVNVSGTNEKIEILGHRQLLGQVLVNVIKNAISYNKENGTVDIGCNVESQQVVIRVTDKGIGISQEDLDRVFERFYRTDRSRSRQTGGSGLGLAIVQSAMRQLGGAVEIESSPNQGTTVSLRFPVKVSS